MTAPQCLIPTPRQRCSGCHTAFGYITEEDPVTQCKFCDRWLHEGCQERHVCPQHIRADQEKLAAWKLACADGMPHA